MTPVSAAVGGARAMLEIVGLSKHYGDVKAVQDLNLTVAAGEVFCMLGANGAGKTTTLMVALGLLSRQRARCGFVVST